MTQASDGGLGDGLDPSTDAGSTREPETPPTHLNGKARNFSPRAPLLTKPPPPNIPPASLEFSRIRGSRPWRSWSAPWSWGLVSWRCFIRPEISPESESPQPPARWVWD